MIRPFLAFMAILSGHLMAADVVTVNPAGKVGINNDAPTQQLDVVGDTKIQGNLTVTGSITGNSARGFKPFPSSGNFVVPPGVSSVVVSVWGGGGGGRGAPTSAGGVGANGGWGGYAKGAVNVIPGATIAITVGNGGAGGAANNGAGGAGGQSAFGSVLVANGGTGGTSSGSTGGTATGPSDSLLATGGTSIFNLGAPMIPNPAGSFYGALGTFPGGGGGGGRCIIANAPWPGGAGAPGLVLIEW